MGFFRESRGGVGNDTGGDDTGGVGNYTGGGGGGDTNGGGAVTGKDESDYIIK